MLIYTCIDLNKNYFSIIIIIIIKNEIVDNICPLCNACGVKTVLTNYNCSSINIILKQKQ